MLLFDIVVLVNQWLVYLVVSVGKWSAHFAGARWRAEEKVSCFHLSPVVLEYSSLQIARAVHSMQTWLDLQTRYLPLLSLYLDVGAHFGQPINEMNAAYLRTKSLKSVQASSHRHDLSGDNNYSWKAEWRPAQVRLVNAVMGSTRRMALEMSELGSVKDRGLPLRLQVLFRAP